MEKILFDEDGNRYKIEEFDRLVNGGLISKLKEEKFVEKIDPDKLFITRDDFGVDFYYKDGERGTVCDNVDMEYDLFVKLLSNGRAYPSYELCEFVQYDDMLPPRLNRFILYCTMAFSRKLSVEGYISRIYIVHAEDDGYTAYQANDNIYTPRCVGMALPAHKEDAEGIVDKFKAGWY